MKKSSLHQKAIKEVCRILHTFTSIPTKEEFLKQFCPKLATAYDPTVSRPIGGIRIGKNGRPVNWGTKSAIQAQNTKRQNEADRIYNECIALIESELKRNQ